MAVHKSAENNPGFLDKIFQTESVWTGRAVDDQTGETATAYGNTKQEAEFNAVSELTKNK
ncbi:MAG: hypothetical protein JWP49_2012 [Phenylobacterium sp.]|nr:hypothetical protein [Phenylobacterium sp.]